MSKTLRALLIDDSEEDANQTLSVLRQGGLSVEHQRVDNAEAMIRALEAGAPWDIVLSDYSMRQFSALEALAILQEKHLDLPLIIVSDTVGEETAVEAMRLGVHDHVLKGTLTRLVPAVEREVRDAAVRAERNSMQEQLLLADRMVSVGTLAAGVAHEINNPLATLMANLEFFAQDIAEFVADARSRAARQRSSIDWLSWISGRAARIAEPLGHAREAAERVRLIARDLKVFSHPDDDRRGPVDVERVLESSVRMSWNEVRHRARLTRRFDPVPPVYANEARLGQVFLNLIVNAAQAIPDGAADHNEITISTRVLDDERAAVEIEDTGCGIPEETLPRIFDPFFTTKPVGVGTGLGLAICRRIVTDFGGEITIESKPGRGTTVRVILPAATAMAEETRPPARASVAPARRASILVVDDEPLLGDVLRRLFAADHDVVTETEAKVALRRMADGERFDVVFCDLIMPVMTGYDLHAELRRLDPAEADKMVFMTGGAFTTAAREFLDSVPNARVDKPFDLTKVRALVRSLLR